MDLQPAQLEALVAIVDHGTFDAAARHLHVTPSAISQRIRALESAAGQVLVRRATPCRVTEAGEALVRLGRQTRLLYDEARDAVGAGGPGGTVDLPVAVNADSLATWFRGALAEVAGWDGVALRLHVEDQGFSGDLLRSGDVLAAVTSDPVAVQGCTVERLGSLRYRPAAAPAFAERWRTARGGRGYDWAAMPVVVFNEKDALQHDLLAQHGVEQGARHGVRHAGRGPTAPAVAHRVPTSTDFHEAVRLGLGWGMIPEPQLAPDLRDGRLVTLSSRQRLDVPLHWQRWRLDSALLDRLSDAVRAAARAGLRL